MIITIDPGTKLLAFARWSRTTGAAHPSQFRLSRCGAVRCKYKMLEDRASALARGMVVACATDEHIEEIVVEMPVVYPHARNKVDPNDLIALAIVAGAAMGAMPGVVSRLVTPAQWKGQRPKDVVERRTLKTLTTDEVEVLLEGIRNVPSSLQHNVYDAVGIGLHRLKR